MSKITVKPQSADHDAFTWDTNYSTVSDFLIVGSTGDPTDTVILFPSITIPQGSTINSAYLIYTAYYTQSNTTVMSLIVADDVDDAAMPATRAEYETVRDRINYANQTQWNSMSAQAAESEYTSPDIKDVIQAKVSREGWESGNAILLLHRDNNSDSGAYRGVYSYDGSSTKCPRLVIDYTVADTPIIGETYPLPPFKRS